VQPTPLAPPVQPAPPTPPAPPVGNPTASGPRIELPDTDTPATSLPRESAIENPLGRAPQLVGSAIGGYGELTLNIPSNAPGVIDLRRVVLYFGHNFTPNLHFYSELEIEHAVSSADDKGEVEIEQAYLDSLFTKHFNLRGGLILMPVGIVNIYHEPPTFNGVDRPDVDQFVIPTTWREAGVGLFGEISDSVRYQLYLVSSFNANNFTADSAIREGHQEAQLARAGDVGVVLRLDYEPAAGTVLGASAYGSTSGNTLGPAVGRVPLGLFEADARTRRGGFSARAEVAVLVVGDAGPLNRALATGTMDQMGAVPVSGRSQGAYGEVGYDLLRLLAPACSHSLTAFGRFDYVDTQADVPSDFTAIAALRRYSGTFGLVYRPIPQIALKADYRRHELGAGPGFNEFASAITWMF
jgi:hypothetical protein